MAEPSFLTTLTILVFVVVAALFAFFLILLGRLINPTRPNPVKNMPYESGMDPIHGARRRFDVRFHLVAIALLVFDVELLFLYPWGVMLGQAAREAALGTPTVAAREKLSEQVAGIWETQGSPAGALSRAVRGGGDSVQKLVPGQTPVSSFAFGAGLLFLLLLVVGYIYDWRKGVFSWR
jgi:NADH-quinone oxidoreductase subunit A